LALSGGHQGRIDDLRVPLTIPTIHPGNDTILTRMGATVYTSVIAKGQYSTGESLANAVRTALGNVPGAWTAQLFSGERRDERFLQQSFPNSSEGTG
jgi:hypothetical protein